MLPIIITITLLIDEARNQTKAGNNSTQVLISGERAEPQHSVEKKKKKLSEQKADKFNPL